MQRLAPAVLVLLTATATATATVLAVQQPDLPPPFPRTNATKLLETERFNVWDIDWPKGQPTALRRPRLARPRFRAPAPPGSSMTSAFPPVTTRGCPALLK